MSEALPGPGAPAQITVYSRPGCHLCSDAWDELVAMHAEHGPYELIEVNIEADDRLHTALLELIPVVEIDGERICELGLDKPAVVGKLAKLGR